MIWAATIRECWNTGTASWTGLEGFRWLRTTSVGCCGGLSTNIVDNVRGRRVLWSYCTQLRISSLFSISFCVKFITRSRFWCGNHAGVTTCITISFGAAVSILLCLWLTIRDLRRSGTLKIFSSYYKSISMVWLNFSKLAHVSTNPGYPGSEQTISSCSFQLVCDCTIRLSWISFIFITRYLSLWTTFRRGAAQLRCRTRISNRCVGACNRRFRLVGGRILIGISIGLGIGVFLKLRFDGLGFAYDFSVSGWMNGVARVVSIRSELLHKLYRNEIGTV